MWWIIGAILFIILAFAAVVAGFLHYGIIRNPRRDFHFFNEKDVENVVRPEYREKVLAGARWIRDHEAEDLFITSFDGLKLHARLMTPENPIGTLILFHGYRSAPVNDFPDFSEWVFDKGYRLLFVDERSGEMSEGRYIGMGVLESRDAVKWAELIAARFESSPIFLQGVSMGASTVLMAMGHDLPVEVKGVIADCGFTSPKEIFESVVKDSMKLPPQPIVDIMGFFIKHIAKYDINVSTVDAIKKSTLPLVLIHGEADDFVPHFMSEKNYAAAKEQPTRDVTFISVPGARHAESYLVDTPKCRDTVSEFLAKYTKV
ncbi:MAG: alpha/beta hydrolase [Clostridiales bacterium]|nr:alpha/beta hydrolase [Clostridiales bacterium]